MHTAEPCQCCKADDATELDAHVGLVCISCRHHLEHVGIGLVNRPGLGLCHPPKFLSVDFEKFPNN